MCVTRWFVVLLLCQGWLSAWADDSRHGKMNVLMIAVDDLRPEVGCYGATYMHTPNIDNLAKAGMVMDRAYCQQAVCSPSRTSLLTGRRPDTTKIYDLNTHFRKTIPDVVTLPECFKKNGYHAQGIGKLYHGDLDDPRSWTVPHWKPNAQTYHNPETVAALEAERKKVDKPGRKPQMKVLERDAKTGTVLKVSRGPRISGPSWEAADVPDNELSDGMIADRAVQVLRKIKDKPFFLGVGFLKPHLPFIAPRKYFDLYPLDKIRLADNPYPPKDVPSPAMSNWGEMRNYSDIPKKGPVSNEKARELIRAYRAATSFTDAQIGRVLDELDKLGLRENTVVVLWGDHGWHLGEHGSWCKHTNFEVATHTLLVISAPGRKAVDVHSKAFVEFVDIYPTLCELCGLTLPEGLEGTSMAPLLDDPAKPWKKAAFSQYPRGRGIMGYSMRTDRYRYTEWTERGKEPEGIELYDHLNDPGENVNVAGNPEMKERIAELKKQLHGGWKSARP